MAVKNKIFIALGAAAILYLIMKANKAFAALVPGQQQRGLDAWGSGAFGASRSGGTRTHNGVDIIVWPGQAILAPISGTITRVAYPYANDMDYKGLELKNDTYKIKIFYVNLSVPVGTVVQAGQKIATAQNIAAKYSPGMTNHAHFEVYDNAGKLINPTNMFIV